MALIKDYPTQFGINATYHKITKIEFLINRLAINIMVAIYASESAKTAGNQPIWHDYIEIPFSAFKSDPRQAFYPLLETYVNSYLIGAQPSYIGELDIDNALVLKPYEPPPPPPPAPPAPPPPIPPQF